MNKSVPPPANLPRNYPELLSEYKALSEELREITLELRNYVELLRRALTLPRSVN